MNIGESRPPILVVFILPKESYTPFTITYMIQIQRYDGEAKRKGFDQTADWPSKYYTVCRGKQEAFDEESSVRSLVGVYRKVP